MSFWKLIWRNLVFYRRTHLAVLLGSAVAAAVLIGAMAVGDCVRLSLRDLALSRLGNTHLAVMGQGRFFRAELASDLAGALHADVSPVLVLDASAGLPDGTARANHVRATGIDQRFWKMGPGGPAGMQFALLKADDVLVNRALAERLAVQAGDSIVLRVQAPSLLPRDAPLSTAEGPSRGQRVTVRGIVEDWDLGRFSLQAAQIAPYNVFMLLPQLGHVAGLPGRADLLLAADPAAGPLTVARANDALKQVWQVGDAELDLRALGDGAGLQLDSPQVFLGSGIVGAVRLAAPPTMEILTYLVNEMHLGDRSTPYSMVSAVGGPASQPSPLPIGMADDEIVINSWLAEDLQARFGDSIDLTWFVLGPGGKLAEQKRAFKVRAILPMTGIGADRDLMPQFPGVADVDNCRDWKSGVPIDLKKIRKKDEDYWDRYRGSPKAFVTLAAGKAMWANRFGDRTALRFAGGPGDLPALAAELRKKIDPASVGLVFQDVRGRALAASNDSLDFGQLFLGFSMFLIVSALVLTGLLFALGVEQRSAEVGTLLAVGFAPGKVRKVLLGEGLVLAAGGAVLGLAGGLLYTKALLYGLSTLWRDAVAGWTIRFHVQPLTLAIAVAAAVASAMGAMGLVLWRQSRRAPAALLAGGGERPPSRPGRGQRWWVGAAAVLAMSAVGLAGWSAMSKGRWAAGAFFGAGSMLLLAALLGSRALLGRLAQPRRRPGTFAPLSLRALGVRNASRRPWRSLAVVSLLACGCFLVAAVGANQQNSRADAYERSSGTGGFALYAESTFGILQDLNTPAGRDKLGLEPADLEGTNVVPMRVRDGDDASCLNLNRAQTPRLLGVNPPLLQHRFSFEETIRPPLHDCPWSLLCQPLDDDAIPAVADETTILWSLGKKLGDTLAYVDDHGQSFRVRLVGGMSNSILQGSVVISEESFLKHYPSQEGHRLFLIDAPPVQAQAVARRLTQALTDYGLEVEPAAGRLAAFAAVENTYLKIFLILGGLGLVLGSGGLALVVLRNVMQRRGELALLAAVGWPRDKVLELVLYEHWLLLLLGLGGGVVAAAVAVLPALRLAWQQVPWVSLSIMLAAVAAGGLVWTYLAAAAALRTSPLEALRNE